MLRIGINRVLDVSYSVAMQCLLSQNYAAECVVCLEQCSYQTTYGDDVLFTAT